MIDEYTTDNVLTPETIFLDLYPTNLSNVETISVQSLPVSIRIINVLMHNGIKTVADLYKMKVDDFLKLRGAGAKCYTEICKYLSDISNNIVELPLSLFSNIATNTVPSIIANNIDNIINQDFSFCDEIDTNSEELTLVENYKEASKMLGTDLVKICYNTPNKILPIIEAFRPLIQSYEERKYKSDKIQKHILSIPFSRHNNNVLGYINAFTNDDESRKTLYYIYNLDTKASANIKDFLFETILDSTENFKILLNFLKWCSFDINKEITELFELLYKKSSNSKTVLLERANGETFGNIGIKMNITRSRVQQIDSQAKRKFSVWQKKTRILSKISADRNGDSVLSATELSEYFGERYSEMVYLLRTYKSPAYYYDSQLDIFVMGDESMASIINGIIESLPDAFSEKEYIDIIRNAIEEQNVPEELIEKAINDEFKKDGTTYHRTHLSLATIYTEIIEKYYSNGIDIYNENELEMLRYIASEEYGCTNLPKNNRAISTRISDIAILCGRGKYCPKKDFYISKDLANKIHEYIVNSPSVIFMTNTLFSIFEDELLEFGIDNKYYLQGVLRELYGSEFVFRRDYVSKDESVTSINLEIIKYIKTFPHPITKEDIQKAFPGITEIVILLATEDQNIINLFGKYIHGSRLNITNSDIVYFENVLRKFIIDDTIKHYKDIYDFIEHDDPHLLNKLFIQFPTNLFSIFEYLFKEQYQFKRPFIANVGVNIGDPEEQLRDLIINSDKIAISEITSFAKDNHYEIYSILEFLNSFNDTHLIMDKKTLATIECIGITDEIANNVINIIQNEVTETTLITSLECVYKFPKINVPWTEWLIYSIINKWGGSITVGTTSNQFKYSVPIIAPEGLLDIHKYVGIAVDTSISIAQVDDLDNIDDLISDLIEFDIEKDLI